jgi:hypothetical protein
MLTTAPGYPFLLVDLDHFGRESGSFMGTIAERLAAGSSTPAPGIGSRLHFQDIGTPLCNFRFSHDRSPYQHKSGGDVEGIYHAVLG